MLKKGSRKLATPNPEGIESLRELWFTFAAIYEGKGFRPVQFIDGWLMAQERKITENLSSEVEFNKLIKAGCSHSAISFCFWFFDEGSAFEPLWKDIFRNIKQHRKTAAALRKALMAFEDERGPVGELEQVVLQCTPKGFPRIDQFVSALQVYSAFFCKLVEQSATIKARSLFEVARYVLTAHVSAKTGHCHDSEVSAIISAACLRNECSVGNQRMWRNRYFKRIHSQMSEWSNLFNDLAIVADAQRNSLNHF